jgi:hypothetical protein
VGKNSSKSKVSGGCSDGAIDVFGLSPELSGTGNVEAGGSGSAEDTTLSFPLERLVLALLPQLTVGQVVFLVRETGSNIAVTNGDHTIGYVPTAYRSKVGVVIRRGDYSALIEDIAHHMVRVRVNS